MMYQQEVKKVDKEIQKYKSDRARFQKRLSSASKGSPVEKRILSVLSDLEKGIMQARAKRDKLLKGVYVPAVQHTTATPKKTAIRSLLDDFKVEDLTVEAKGFARRLHELASTIEQAANLVETTPQIVKSFKSMFTGNGSKINLGQLDKIARLLSDYQLLGMVQELNTMFKEKD